MEPKIAIIVGLLLFVFVSLGMEIRICQQCRKEFSIRQPHFVRQKFCSRECGVLSNAQRQVSRRKASLETTLRTILQGIKFRSKAKGRECNLTIAFLMNLLAKQKGLCAATGIELRCTAGAGHAHKDPFTISVDRIESSKGYTENNVQLVCVIYNEAKNQYTPGEVLFMAHKLIAYGS